MDDARVIGDVQRLRQSLGQLPERVARPVFVVVSGLPGTGKSHFSRQLSRRLPCLIVESDAIRKTLCPSPTYRPHESHRVFQACHRLIKELLGGGISVILDATNLVEQHRERLYRISDSLRVRLIVVQVVAPREVVRQRLQRRSAAVEARENSDADWTVYQRMQAKAERIGRNYFSVDTSMDIAPVIDKIVREAAR